MQKDAHQGVAVAEFQRIYEELLATPPRALLGDPGPDWPPVKGLYLWGSVGRGKTWLMDLFYASLPFSRKQRTHFHRFMQQVHEARKGHRNRADPLGHIATDLAKRARVLCFDEFYVSDVADAMILGRLTEALFNHGVTLVATSNSAPQSLYAGGLKRERFLPAIERIENNCRVMQLDGDIDHRLRQLERAEIYHAPLDAAADANLAEYFNWIAPDAGKTQVDLTINKRPIPCRRLSDGLVWFDFQAICGEGRSSADYIEIARCFHTLLVSMIPQFDWALENEARRFIDLVDESYDHNVKLILSAETEPETLYAGNKLGSEFRRTISRLTEMQSREYLARPHLP